MPLALVRAVPVWIVALAWCVGGLGMGLAISALSVLLLRLSPPAEAGANSAALQVSDALSNVLLVAAAGTAFTALGGGSAAASAASRPHLPPGRLRRGLPPGGRHRPGGLLIAARLAGTAPLTARAGLDPVPGGRR